MSAAEQMIDEYLDEKTALDPQEKKNLLKAVASIVPRVTQEYVGVKVKKLDPGPGMVAYELVSPDKKQLGDIRKELKGALGKIRGKVGGEKLIDIVGPEKLGKDKWILRVDVGS